MFAFLLILAAPSPAITTVEHIGPQEAAKRVSQCGLGPVRTHYDGDLDEDVLVASSAESATDAQLACAYNVIGFYYTMELPRNAQRRFDAMLGAKAGDWMGKQARAWLSARGLLSRVPKYQKGVTDDAAFTQQVEALCGPRARGAFQSKYGFHTLSPDWVARQLKRFRGRDDVLSCLMNVTTEAGFGFGFIGNEYYRR